MLMERMRAEQDAHHGKEADTLEKKAAQKNPPEQTDMVQDSQYPAIVGDHSQVPGILKIPAAQPNPQAPFNAQSMAEKPQPPSSGFSGKSPRRLARSLFMRMSGTDSAAAAITKAAGSDENTTLTAQATAFYTNAKQAVQRWEASSRFVHPHSFLKQFPAKLGTALTGKANTAALAETVTKIGAAGMGQSAESTNRTLGPEYAERTMKGIDGIFTFLQAENGSNPQQVEHGLADMAEALENQSVSPFELVENTNMLIEAAREAQSFENPASAQEQLLDMAFTLATQSPDVASHLSSDSIHALGEAARRYPSEDASYPLLAHAGSTLTDLAQHDDPAAHIFSQTVFAALEQAIETNGYTQEAAAQFVSRSAQLLAAANGNRQQSDEDYDWMRILINDYGALLNGITDETAFAGIAGSLQGGEHAQNRISRVTRGLDATLALGAYDGARGNETDEQSQLAAYNEFTSLPHLPAPYAVRRIRTGIEAAAQDGQLSGETLPVSAQPILRDITQWYQTAPGDQRDIMNGGLSQAFASGDHAATTIEHWQDQEHDAPLDYLYGVGAVHNALHHPTSRTDLSSDEGIGLPENAAGDANYRQGLTRLARMHRDAAPADRLHYDSMIARVWTNPETRQQFLAFLTNDANPASLSTLGWVARLGEHMPETPFTERAFADPTLLLPETTEPDAASSTALVPAEKQDTGLVPLGATPRTSSLGTALSLMSNTVGNDAEALAEIGTALTRTRLRTVEDAETLAAPIIGALTKFFHLDREVLESNRFRFRKAADIIDEATEGNDLAHTIGTIMSIVGEGNIPTLAYGPDNNEVIINEQVGGGWRFGGLGEELAHWARETVHPSETPNPVTHEFFGFLGQRIAHAAVGTEGPVLSQQAIKNKLDFAVESLLSIEHYKHWDIGYAQQITETLEHAIGYTAAHTIPLDAIPDGVIYANDTDVLPLVSRHGPPDSWYEKVIRNARREHENQKRQKRITDEVTPLSTVLRPIMDVFEKMPHIQNLKQVRWAKAYLAAEKK